jgi:magnesium transporter
MRSRSSEDLIASLRGDMPHPEISAIEVKRSGRLLVIPLSQVAVLTAPAIPLTGLIQDIATYEPEERDLYLARDVLDKQIIDTNGVRVVRVNAWNWCVSTAISTLPTWTSAARDSYDAWGF